MIGEKVYDSNGNELGYFVKTEKPQQPLTVQFEPDQTVNKWCDVEETCSLIFYTLVNMGCICAIVFFTLIHFSLGMIAGSFFGFIMLGAWLLREHQKVKIARKRRFQ